MRILRRVNLRHTQDTRVLLNEALHAPSNRPYLRHLKVPQAGDVEEGINRECPATDIATQLQSTVALGGGGGVEERGKPETTREWKRGYASLPE